MNICKKKIFYQITLLFVLLFLYNKSNAQANDGAVFTMFVHYKDTSNVPLSVPLKTSFENVKNLYDYANALPQLLSGKGYLLASIDSTWQVQDTLHILLFVGTQYNWVQLNAIGVDKALLAKVEYNQKDFINKPINIDAINKIKEKLLKVYENEGYPFAKIFLDSVKIKEDTISASLMVYKLILYKIDSIKNFGKLKLNKKFIQQYLGIKNSSPYNIEKLKDVDRRMQELTFVEVVSPSTLNMLSTGATLNLNVNTKKSSEASAILGFLPSANNTGKLQVTGDVNLDLKNVFGGGEGLLLRYQALQPKSPRLNVGFDKPYIFNTAFGVGFLFELFKKDSTFLNLNAQVNIKLNLSKYQSAKFFIQIQNNSLLPEGIDSNKIKIQKILPDIIDVTSTNVGVAYEYSKTNYKFNPIKGNEVMLTTSLGIKKIEKNNNIISFVDPLFDFNSLYNNLQLKSYQLRIKLAASHYFPLSKTSTLKAAINTALYNSPSIFRNEVYQIGGYKLLRGFDEESIYATQYGVITAEYRALLSLNSYFFTFIDIGSTNTRYQTVNSNNFFTSAGLGILYETKAGLLNLSLALGKRNDVPFKLNQASKIHFGYINYF
jgi:hypothetical protein